MEQIYTQIRQYIDENRQPMLNLWRDLVNTESGTLQIDGVNAVCSILRREMENAGATLRERNRIAREIHDNVGHMLSRSILQMGALITIHNGMTLRSAEITMLEQTRTKVMARPMPTAPETVVVTASAEQQPSTRRRTGFSRMIPAVKTFHLLGFSFIVTAPP